MNKGHMEYWELIIAALLIVGLAAGVFFIMGASGSGGSAPVANITNQSAAPVSGNNAVPAPSAPSAVAQQPSNTVVPPQSNETLGAMMDDGLNRSDYAFYHGNVTGQVHISTFRWYLGDLNQLPDSVPVQQNDNRVAYVRFNGKYEDSLRGFVFRIYQITDAAVAPKILVTAIFLSNQTPLDQFKANGTAFTIYYGPHPQGPQLIEGCTPTWSQQYTVNQSVVTVYDISCKDMYGTT